MSRGDFYWLGGTISLDAPSYITRKADTQLYEALRDGDFAYVLTPRQQGKSSLMNRVARRLRLDGATVVILDLSASGFNLEAGHWYNGLISQLGQRLQLDDEIDDYCLEHDHLSPLQLWQGALRDVVLKRTTGKLVLFLDEIDIVRSLPFSTDELFAAIRACYNARAEQEIYSRLTFCLLGVATPNDLIQNPKLTPFNIGQRIELTDFTPTEAAPLQDGLGKGALINQKLLARVLWWTGGHPYLTQRLCQAVSREEAALTEAHVDRICQEMFLAPEAGKSDDNLSYVQQRLLAVPSDALTPEAQDEWRAALLTRYLDVLKGRNIADNETNEFVPALKLSGVVQASERRLVPRNRIYAHVFDKRWVREHLPGEELRRIQRAFRRGIFRTLAVAIPLLALIGWLAVTAIFQRQRAELLGESLTRSSYAGDLNQGFQQLQKGFFQGVEDRLKGATVRWKGEDMRGFEWRYLWSKIHGEELDLRRHNSGVFCLAVSPDGLHFATGGFDSRICLWDARSGRCLREVEQLDGPVMSLAFSPDGRKLAAGLGLKRAWVGVWEVESGNRLHYTELQPNYGLGRVAGLVFTDRALLIAIDDLIDKPNHLACWYLGKEIQGSAKAASEHLEMLPMPASFAFGDGSTLTRSPDGGMVVAAGMHRNSRDPTAPELYQRRLPEGVWTKIIVKVDKGDHFDSVAFSPDGSWLVGGTMQGNLYTWRVGKWDMPARVFKVSQSSLHSLTFSPEGDWLVAGSWDHKLYTFSVPAFKPCTSAYAHRDLINSVAFLPGQPGLRLISAGNDRSVRIWDWNKWLRSSGQVELTSLPLYEVSGPYLSPDPAFLAASALAIRDKPIALWQLNPPRLLQADSGRGRVLGLSQGARWLAIADKSGRGRVIEVATRRTMAQLGSGMAEARVYFSLNNRWMAVAKDGGISLWSLPDFRRVDEFRDALITAQALISPGSRYLLRTRKSAPYTLVIRDLLEKRDIQTLKMPQNGPTAMAFSPDDTLLVAADWNGPITVWEVASGRERARFVGHTAFVSALAFSQDSKTLVTGGYIGDGTLKFWNTATWREVGEHPLGVVPVSSIAFLPEDRGIALIGPKSLHVTNVPSFEEIITHEKAGL